eukprot:TRINITY_DN1358_c3_g2_i1.p1 TRINITY_DN1358_c3_g2~~TRINITY_DN1358_c3_g2_i1.p1  ORF type:complete len:306 (+),score=95.38 TRINITY_DN1358_c3_g2_i1:72-920(+)
MPIQWSGAFRSALAAPRAYDDPTSASFQRFREAKNWYVCPRNPFVDGGKLDAAPFFDTQIRRVGDAPAKWIWGSLYAGLLYGFGLHVQRASGIGSMSEMGMLDTRISHGWAMRRLFFLRMTRPAVIAGGLMSSYWVPRELFSQNFGRRNRRHYFDGLPHFVGAGAMYFCSRPFLGTHQAKSAFWLIFMVGLVQEYFYALGHSLNDQQRDHVYPATLAARFGLPDGGEGYDGLVGGEHGQYFQLESSVTGLYTPSAAYKVRNNNMLENHPMFRIDFGHYSLSI